MKRITTLIAGILVGVAGLAGQAGIAAADTGAGTTPRVTTAPGSLAAAHACNLVFTTRNGGTGWFAGYSDTWTTETVRGQNNNRVIEAQCLVLSLGISVGPTGADGDFGGNTEKGVIAAQKLCFPHTQSEWDGRVGPHTWNCLRTF
jgi:peptidoglycan hydrolase-like protein with peptidoglycan-binding domain